MTYMPMGQLVMAALRQIARANLMPMTNLDPATANLLVRYNLALSTGHSLYLTDEGQAALKDGWAVVAPQPSPDDSRLLRQEFPNA